VAGREEDVQRHPSKVDAVPVAHGRSRDVVAPGEVDVLQGGAEAHLVRHDPAELVGDVDGLLHLEDPPRLRRPADLDGRPVSLEPGDDPDVVEVGVQDEDLRERRRVEPEVPHLLLHVRQDVRKTAVDQDGPVLTCKPIHPRLLAAEVPEIVCDLSRRAMPHGWTLLKKMEDGT
jgi:hypothetical protein